MADTPDWRTQLHSGSRQRIYAPDWRIQLESDSRQRIVNKIMDTLKRHLPVSGPEGLLELNRSAVRFEEKVYTAATSQSDYLRKISLKLLTMETKSQNTAVVNSIPQNAVASNQNRPNPAQAAGAGAVQNCMVDDWRIQLQAISRQQIVNKIMDTLKRHLPISGPEGLLELNKIAVKFEEKVYTAATSQSDYLRKISLKLLTMETKSQNTAVVNSIPQNAVASNQNPPNPAQAAGAGAVQNCMVDDWRIQLQAISRQQIVNKIMDTLKRHLPISGPEGLLELNKIAVKFEEKVYTAATSQSDYLRKISFKMLTMETNSQNTAEVNSIPHNAVASNQNPPNPAQGAGAGADQNCMVDAPDWRIQLQADSRQRIVNKIMDNLKRFRPISSPEELQELTEIAVRFEEKIYSVATSQLDYLRKISLKMLTMEAKDVK